MARQTFSNGDSGALVRAVIDSNFTELYDTYLPKAGGVLSGPIEIPLAIQNKQSPAVNSNSLTLNLSGCSFFYVTLSSAINSGQFTLTNVPPTPGVFSFNLQFTYTSNTPHTVSWPTSFKWSSGIAPTLTCLNGKNDLFTFLTHDGGVNWFAFVSELNQ